MKKEPFGSLSTTKSKRQSLLSTLLEALLKEGFEIVFMTSVAKRKRLLKDAETLWFTEVDRIAIARLQDRSNIPAMSRVVSQIEPWHRSTFLCLVCSQAVADLVIQKKEMIKEWVIPEIENIIGSECPGFFYPLDDELVIHGSDLIESIVSQTPGFESLV